MLVSYIEGKRDRITEIREELASVVAEIKKLSPRLAYKLTKFGLSGGAVIYGAISISFAALTPAMIWAIAGMIVLALDGGESIIKTQKVVRLLFRARELSRLIEREEAELLDAVEALNGK